MRNFLNKGKIIFSFFITASLYLIILLLLLGKVSADCYCDTAGGCNSGYERTSTECMSGWGAGTECCEMPSHLECSNGDCVTVYTAGADTCTGSADCKHNECVSGTCKEVVGQSSDLCTSNSECDTSSEQDCPWNCYCDTAGGCNSGFERTSTPCTSGWGSGTCCCSACGLGAVECDGECCGDDTNWFCQYETGNLIKEKKSCFGIGCAYDYQNCGECQSSGICSMTDCECDYECDLIVPGCSASGAFCTELSSISCGYTNCNYCSEGFMCRVEDGVAGCYPDEGTPPPDQTCAEQGGTICSPDEVCGDEAWGGGLWLSATDTIFCCDSSCHISTYSGGCPSGCSCTLGCDGIWLYNTGQVCDYYYGGTGTCWCQSPIASSCGNEECNTDLGENCDTCPEDCACIPPKECINSECVDSGGPSCSCGSWSTSDTNCVGCSNSCQKYYTRNCNPPGCGDEDDCKTPSYGNCVYENECSTTGLQSNACGCTRTCTRTVSLPYTTGGNEKIGGQESYCSDTIDNDCDGLTDGEDPDCTASYVDVVVAVSNFYNKAVPVVLLNISNPSGFENGNLILFVLDEDGALVDSCTQLISLAENKLFFGTPVKNIHFYQWAESMLLTNEEIYECQEDGMGSYMDDDCKHHDCSKESFVNSVESEFYNNYPGLLILENTPSYLSSPDNFVEIELSDCMSIFSNLAPGSYDLTASLEVIP